MLGHRFSAHSAQAKSSAPRRFWRNTCGSVRWSFSVRNAAAGRISHAKKDTPASTGRAKKDTPASTFCAIFTCDVQQDAASCASSAHPTWCARAVCVCVCLCVCARGCACVHSRLCVRAYFCLCAQIPAVADAVPLPQQRHLDRPGRAGPRDPAQHQRRRPLRQRVPRKRPGRQRGGGGRAHHHARACVRACVRAGVRRACARACVRLCVLARLALREIIMWRLLARILG